MKRPRNSIPAIIGSVLFTCHAGSSALHADVVFSEDFQSYAAIIVPIMTIVTIR